MKRTIGTVALAMIGSAVFAQNAPFTIIYPPDGTKVKEKLSIRFPNNSVPSNSYVGIFLDGKLMEATKPTLVTPKKNGKPSGRPYYEYLLDVKGRGIPDSDGKSLELKAVLFNEVNDTPRIISDSSVRIIVDKSAGIPIPSGGFAMRYNFKAGTELKYELSERLSITQITESQKRLGGRAAEVPLPDQATKIRLLYAFDNTIPYGKSIDYIVRMQALPEKGKTYADLVVSGETAAKRYQDYELAPIYMQMSPTGLQRWGSIPPYIEFEGTSGEGSRLDLFAAFPLPTLPEKSVKPGDSWPSRFQYGAVNLEKLHESTSVVRTFPARGEFVGVEYERGRRCAVIRNVIEEAVPSFESKGLAKAGVQENEKTSLKETIWFDLDRKLIVKVIREQTIETTEDASRFLGFSSGAGAAAGAPAGAPPAGAPGDAGGAAGSGLKRGGGLSNGNKAVSEDKQDLRQFPPQRGGRGGAGLGAPGLGQGPSGPAGMGFPGVPGGQGFGGGRMGQLNAQDKVITVIRIQRTFVLE